MNSTKGDRRGFRRPLLGASLVLIFGTSFLAGCDRTQILGGRLGPQRVEQNTIQPVGPGQFVWENQPLRRSGESTVPSPGMPTSDLLARAEARRSALRALDQAIRELPVNQSATVGQAMDRSVSLSLAVSRLLQKAKTVEGTTTRQADGRIALTVELPTAELAEALRVHRVTPEKGLPAQPAQPVASISGTPVV